MGEVPVVGGGWKEGGRQRALLGVAEAGAVPG